MPLAHKTSPSILPESLENQIKNNFTREEDVTSTIAATSPAPVVAESEGKVKSKYSDSVNLRLTTGKRNEFKTFFTQCEISMNQGFEMAVDYLIREVKAGNIKVSKSGITKNEG